MLRLDSPLNERTSNTAIKFTASVPKFVDPDPITCIIEPSSNPILCTF